MGQTGSGNDLILYLLVIAFVYSAWRFLRRRFPPHRPEVSISRQQILYFAYGRHTLQCVLFTLLPCLLLAAMCIGGRIGVGTLLVSVALIWIFPLFHIISHRRLQRRALMPVLKRGIDIDAELRGKKLVCWGDNWYYSDDNWYILVGSSQSILLCARLIDFSKPPRQQSRMVMYITGRNPSSRTVYEQVFTGLDGEEYFANGSVYSDDLQAWFRRDRKRFSCNR